jgi:GNAT superfamily N-acetyltransferase
MRMHDKYILQVNGPPAVGVYPGLRELYALADPPAPASLRDLRARLYGTESETDTFYYATYEKHVVAALDVTASKTARKVGAVHRLFTAHPFRRGGLGQQQLLQAAIDFQCLGGEMLLLTVPRSSPGYRWIRNARFSSYPDILFLEAPAPIGAEAVVDAWPPPELNPAAQSAPTDSSGSGSAADSSGEPGDPEWGSYDSGGGSESNYSGGYGESDYGNYGVKPALPDPTRTDGVALFYGLFGRVGLRDFALSHFSVNLAATVRPARYSDWAALMLLVNWPNERRLVHWHRPLSRSQPLDWEILELLERVQTGRASAVVLETADTGIVGLAAACLPPTAGDPAPPPPGKRAKVAPAAGAAVVDVYVHPDFVGKTPELVKALKAQRPSSGSTAFVDESGPLKGHFEQAGFKPVGAAPAEIAAIAPGVALWKAT